MYTTKKIAVRRDGFTLIEMLVVIAIILAVAAMAAVFAPSVNDNQKLSRAVDNLEQWLLTAKMRARRDGLSTGLRFVPAPGDAPGTYSQFQYIQQPDPLVGGYIDYAGVHGGTIVSASGGMVTFGNVDFSLSLGANPPLDAFGRQQWLVQTGDYLEINGGGVFSIWGVVFPAPGLPATQLVLGGSLGPTSANTGFTSPWTTPVQATVVASVPVPYPTPTSVTGALATFAGLAPPANTGSPLTTIISPLFPPAQLPPPGSFLWQSAYEQSLVLGPTTNYRILRQPRVLIGEEPVTLPTNYAANFNPIPGSGSLLPGSNVLPGASGYPEILFSPTGAVVGSNAGTPIICISVWDTTLDLTDPNVSQRVGIVGVQSRSGFIGAYSVSLSGNPFLFVQTARESGL